MVKLLKNANLSIFQKNIAIKTFNGFKEADKIILKERLNDLAGLTVKKGLSRFNELYRFYEMTRKSGRSDSLDKLKIKDHCTLRRRLNLLAEKEDGQ